MKLMDVVYYSGSAQTFIYTDDEHEAADMAFSKLKTAIDEYHKFKNDKGESVTIAGSSGETVFRIEHLVSVSLQDASIGERANIEFAKWRKRIKDTAEIEAA